MGHLHSLLLSVWSLEAPNTFEYGGRAISDRVAYYVVTTTTSRTSKYFGHRAMTPLLSGVPIEIFFVPSTYLSVRTSSVP